MQRCLDQGRYDDAREAGRRLRRRDRGRRPALTPVQLRRAQRSLERLDQNLDPRAYWRCSRPRRLLVITAGPIANVIACFVILSAVGPVRAPRGRARRPERDREVAGRGHRPQAGRPRRGGERPPRRRERHPLGDRERQGRAGHARRRPRRAPAAAAHRAQQGDRRRLPARLPVRHDQPALLDRARADLRRAGDVGAHDRHRARARRRGHPERALAAALHRRDRARVGPGRAGRRDRLPGAAGVHLAVARHLQPAAVPAPGRRARADDRARADPGQDGVAGRLRAGVGARHHADGAALRGRATERPLEHPELAHENARPAAVRVGAGRVPDRAATQAGWPQRATDQSVGGSADRGRLARRRAVDDADRDERRARDARADRSGWPTPAASSPASPCPDGPTPTRCRPSWPARRCR